MTRGPRVGALALTTTLVVLGSGIVHASTASTEPSPRERALAREANLYAADKHADAAARFVEVLRLREAATSADDPSVVSGLRALPVIRAAEGRRADALALMRRALPIAEETMVQARAAFAESRMAGPLEYLRVDEDTVYSRRAGQ